MRRGQPPWVHPVRPETGGFQRSGAYECEHWGKARQGEVGRAWAKQPGSHLLQEASLALLVPTCPIPFSLFPERRKEACIVGHHTEQWSFLPHDWRECLHGAVSQLLQSSPFALTFVLFFKHFRCEELTPTVFFSHLSELIVC